jgi:hypothetical protein
MGRQSTRILLVKQYVVLFSHLSPSSPLIRAPLPPRRRRQRHCRKLWPKKFSQPAEQTPEKFRANPEAGKSAFIATGGWTLP